MRRAPEQIEIVGAREEDMRLVEARRGRGYDSVRDLWLRTRLSPAVLERLAAAGVIVAIGHTAASPEIIRDAVSAGVMARAEESGRVETVDLVDTALELLRAHRTSN